MTGPIDLKREKLEKKYQKMMKLYTRSKNGATHFDVRQLDLSQFRFQTVSAAEPETE